MRSVFAALPFIGLTFLCWGNYGPLMHEGQIHMEGSSLRPFVCVGLAYFLIAVVVPVLALVLRGERGSWTMPGIFWSLFAGTLGAVGAMGIIMAFKYRGWPVYVMPLVFGGAPVVNTFVTMTMSHTYRNAGRLFFVGVAAVAIGAAGVMYYKPAATNVTIEESQDGAIQVVRTRISANQESVDSWRAANLQELRTNPDLNEAHKLYLRKKRLSPKEFFLVLGSIILTATCWGSYGPFLHKGQMKMRGSRLRPFLCVGFAYFAVAVVVPLFLMSLPMWQEPGAWLPNRNPSGILWSMGAGAAGALGALGIIMAFNFGGKPIFVMPLIFGCAPIVNTFTTIYVENTWSHVRTPFLISLMIVVVGAVTVLVFSPRAPHGKPPAADDDQPAEKAASLDDSSSQVEVESKSTGTR